MNSGFTLVTPMQFFFALQLLLSSAPLFAFFCLLCSILLVKVTTGTSTRDGKYLTFIKAQGAVIICLRGRGDWRVYCLRHDTFYLIPHPPPSP